MYLGDVLNKKCRKFLVVSKQGFASLYVLVIIQIVLAFVLLLLSSCTTLLANKQMSNDLHAQQLYALYHVKAYMKQDIAIGEEPHTEEGNAFKQEEIIAYRNQDIYITYQSAQVDIVIAHLHIQLEIDEESKNIIGFVYI